VVSNGNTVVKHLIIDPQIEGSNPVIAWCRAEMAAKYLFLILKIGKTFFCRILCKIVKQISSNSINSSTYMSYNKLVCFVYAYFKQRKNALAFTVTRSAI
jgi:hypothetical protein